MIEAFHDEITKIINSDAFHGDKASVLAAWHDCGAKERKYRETVETEARLNAPEPNGNAWWEILGVAPDSPDDTVPKAYTERLKQCHPDRVAGLAPELVQVADDMAKRLNHALEEGKHRPTWWATQ